MKVKITVEAVCSGCRKDCHYECETDEFDLVDMAIEAKRTNHTWYCDRCQIQYRDDTGDGGIKVLILEFDDLAECQCGGIPGHTPGGIYCRK